MIRKRQLVHVVVLLVALLNCARCVSRSVKDLPLAKQKKSLNGVNLAASSTNNVGQRKTAQNTPRIGVCERNFAGRDVRVIAETGGGLNFVEDATLPVLKIDDHIWNGKSIQLTCNASYPVKFEYHGPGVREKTCL